MPKAEVDINILDEATLCQLGCEFGLKVASSKKLYGGFSCTNYCISSAATGQIYVLKVCNNYTRQHVVSLCKLLNWVKLQDLSIPICFPIPLKDKTGSCDAENYVTTTLGPQKPTILLTFVPGMAADKVIEGQARLSQSKTMEVIGQNLARLHAVPLPLHESNVTLRSYTHGGACEVQNHVSGHFANALADGATKFEDVRKGDFLPFYRRAVVELKMQMSAAATDCFPDGILHGDPFLDNMLLLPRNGEIPRFGGFVDFEDICVGPLIFDVAVCAIGCCFRDTGNCLDFDRLRGLLLGYQQVRPLQINERQNFVAFMRLALLCNCSWRYRNFEIDHREVAEGRGSYKELWDRIKDLQSGPNIAQVEAIVNNTSTQAMACILKKGTQSTHQIWQRRCLSLSLTFGAAMPLLFMLRPS